MKIAVIVPYYQEASGILTRCLSSIFRQSQVSQHQVRIIVIDDASPLDPVFDIEAAGPPPANMYVELIRRQNGGPGAARNTGLDVVSGQADVIALIDSDDTWSRDHLRRAAGAIESGFDIYFSDHDRGSPQSRHLPQSALFSQIATQSFDSSRFLRLNDNLVGLDANDTAEFFALEYLAHTSSIAYKARKLGGVRMLEDLRAAGEDHLFFVDLVLASSKICMSLESEVSLGAGVNIYLSAFDWGSERDLRRRTYNLASLKIMRRRADWSRRTQKQLDRRLGQARLTLGQLLARQLIAAPGNLPGVARFIWKFDPLSVVGAPVNAFLFNLGLILRSHRVVEGLR